jgi:NADH dehydrogenase [ubiquinone] 1 alpha subcomplex assembly factor 7
MKTNRKSRAAVLLMAIAWLTGGNAWAAEGPAADDPLSDKALKAAGERIRQTGQDLQADIQQALRKARAERVALEARQAAERKKEEQRARQRAAQDAAELAAAKEARQRQALAVAQAKARKEAEERAAKAESERLAAIKAQRELEDKLAREQQATKAKADKPKLGDDTKFGVDI